MIQEHRASGLSVADWCKEQGIPSQTYYYRLRKIREAACQHTPSEQETEFVPVTFPDSDSLSSNAQASWIQQKFQLNPFENSLFLFCGRKKNRLKALYWERDGFVLLYKRLENGKFQWPMDSDAAREITPQEFRWILEGLSIDQPKAVKKQRSGIIL